jgi:beta-galactosidase/beta-glucuronidase
VSSSSDGPMRHRSEELIRNQSNMMMTDFRIQADDNGHLKCSIEINHQQQQQYFQSSTITKHNNNNNTKRSIVARLYNDQQLDPDGYEWKQGICIWSSSTELIQSDYDNNNDETNHNKTKNKHYNISGDLDIEKTIQLWSSETPNLYTLTISVVEEIITNDNDAISSTPSQHFIVHQVESCRVGFRTVNIVNGCVMVNHQKFIVCGINRHEFDPDTGKVMNMERMKHDICLLK